MLEDPPPASLDRSPLPEATVAPEAPDLSPEDWAEEVPTVVMRSFPAPNPQRWELLDLIRTELLIPSDPPAATRPPDPPELKEKSPESKERREIRKYQISFPVCFPSEFIKVKFLEGTLGGKHQIPETHFHLQD